METLHKILLTYYCSAVLMGVLQSGYHTKLKFWESYQSGATKCFMVEGLFADRSQFKNIKQSLYDSNNTMLGDVLC